MNPHVLIMGVSGAGKSTLASALSERLAWPLLDGDDLHPEHNVERMRRGEPLDDSHRWPWFAAIAETLNHSPVATVIACSALKVRYRDYLREAVERPLFWVHLRASRALLEARLQQRVHAYMPASLLDSQLRTLESTDDVNLLLPADDTVERLCDQVLLALAPRS